MSFKFSSTGKKILEFSFQMCRWVFLSLEQLLVCVPLAQQGWAPGSALHKVTCKQGVLPFIAPWWDILQQGLVPALPLWLKCCVGAVTGQVFAGPFSWTPATQEATNEVYHCKDSSFSCPDPIGEGSDRMVDEQGCWAEVIKTDLLWTHLEQAPGLALACGTGTDLSAGRSLYVGTVWDAPSYCSFSGFISGKWSQQVFPEPWRQKSIHPYRRLLKEKGFTTLSFLDSQSSLHRGEAFLCCPNCISYRQPVNKEK